MPAYGKLLSDHDILAVLAYIKSSWPKQAWVDLLETLEPCRPVLMGAVCCLSPPKKQPQ